MSNRKLQIAVVLLAAAGAAILLTGSRTSPSQSDRIERGRYLATAIACADCHSPKNFGADGPEPDLKRPLSGHPQEMVLPPAPALPPGPWIVSTVGSLTAWSGPWGTSFAANLSPDDETGLGRWTEEEFIAALRTGRHMGRGRPILPPMPVAALASLTDEDLRSIFAYLQSLPATKNRVPEPLPPADASATAAAPAAPNATDSSAAR